MSAARSALGADLVFVISQPRAGSTLLQRLLATHPAVHTPPEPWVALHPLFALKAGAVSAPYDHRFAVNATCGFLDAIPGGYDAYLDGVRHLLAGIYRAALAPTSARIFVDKTPRYYFIIPELRRVFPEARIVLLLRNPVAVLASVLDTWVLAADGDGLASYWHDLVEAPRLLAEALAVRDPKTSVVHYESLVQEPDRVMAGLFDELGLEPGEGSVDYGHVSPMFMGSPLGDQGTVFRHSRPTAERVDRWKVTTRLHPHWTSLAYGYLQSMSPELLAVLGYDRAELIDALGDRTGLEPGAFSRLVGDGSAEAVVRSDQLGYLRRLRVRRRHAAITRGMR